MAKPSSPNEIVDSRDLRQNGPDVLTVVSVVAECSTGGVLKHLHTINRFFFRILLLCK